MKELFSNLNSYFQIHRFQDLSVDHWSGLEKFMEWFCLSFSPGGGPLAFQDEDHLFLKVFQKAPTASTFLFLVLKVDPKYVFSLYPEGVVYHAGLNPKHPTYFFCVCVCIACS